MADPESVIRAVGDQGVDLRVLSVPLEAVPQKPGEPARDRMQRINDAMAELCALDDRLVGLASIDAYAGDDGAVELHRAVDTLGLVGCFVECANRGTLISDQVAAPTLAAAASRDLPVFVHPVQESTLNEKYKAFSFYQMNLGRAAIASTALAAMLEAGTFDALPNLNICVSSFAIAGLIMGGLFDMTRPDAAEVLRKHVYVDTVGLTSPMLLATSGILGIERLVAASAEAGFSPEQRDLIASGNARRLFGSRLESQTR